MYIIDMAEGQTEDQATRKRDRAPSFKLEFPGDKIVRKALASQMTDVKTRLHDLLKLNASNTETLKIVFQYWLDKHENYDHEQFVGNYVQATRGDVDQQLFVCAKDSVTNLIQQTIQHSRLCNSPMDIHECGMSGHVATMTVRCAAAHTFRWLSSPYTPDNKFLVNVRMQHGILSSGLRYVEYESVMNAVDIGVLSHHVFDDTLVRYAPIVEDLARQSMEDALLEEIAAVFHPDHDDPDGDPGITILTDARHGGRRNANDCDVVAIGLHTHKVLKTVHVTKEDDPVSQRHEMFGTVKIYEYFDNCLQGDGVPIKCHGHDSNTSVNKYIRTQRPDTKGQNDTWHGGKNVVKVVKTVAGGAQMRDGITWHSELADKVEKLELILLLLS